MLAPKKKEGAGGKKSPLSQAGPSLRARETKRPRVSCSKRHVVSLESACVLERGETSRRGSARIGARDQRVGGFCHREGSTGRGKKKRERSSGGLAKGAAQSRGTMPQTKPTPKKTPTTKVLLPKGSPKKKGLKLHLSLKRTDSHPDKSGRLEAVRRPAFPILRRIRRKGLESGGNSYRRKEGPLLPQKKNS